MASAGRVLLISKGAWVSGTPYDPMDFVYYGGNSYVCKASVSGSTTPDSDITHWQVMASGFDADLITQTITNDATKIASDAAVYTETQKLESNFAVIQASNVATQAFAIGDYLTYQGELYKVTSAIANGGTITPGTNCIKTSVGTQLDALNDSLTPTSVTYTANSQTNYTLSNVVVRNVGKIMFVNFIAVAETPYITNPGITCLSGIPVPAYGFSQLCVEWSNVTTSGSHLRVYVLPTGEISLRNGIQGQTYDVNLVYIAA